jgi:hypothetical protein
VGAREERCGARHPSASFDQRLSALAQDEIIDIFEYFSLILSRARQHPVDGA